MKSHTRLVLLITVASGALCSPARAQVPTLPSDGGVRLEGPSCATFDREHQPVTTFRAGDELILTGSRFPADSGVLATFQQAPHSSELGRFTTNQAGDFTSEPSVVRLPADALDGPAAIRVSSSGGSADCELVVRAPAAAPVVAAGARDAASEDPEPEDTNTWLIVWGTLVAIAGVFLAYVTYRRWQAERLAEAMSRLNGGGRLQAATRRDRPASEFTGSITEADAPQVLDPGWDAGREPTPIKPNE